MPTGEVAPQQAVQVSAAEGMKGAAASPTNMSPINSTSAFVADKTNFYGVEVLDKLVWKGWEQGKEITKNLVLKNLSVKTLKLKYRGPETRFFSTIYPKPIFLSAGASFTLPVTFRPLENIPYDDSIVFTLKGGDKFEIPLKAVLPRTDISIPYDLDFNMCAVKNSYSISFEVYNTGDLDTFVQWSVKDPFVINPPNALVKYKGSTKFTATFKPEAAFVYEVTAVCNFGQELENSRATTFYGIGKFPHLLVSQPGKKARTANSDKLNSLETEINFGTVAVANSATQWVELHNLSPVQTPFRVERIVGMSRMDTAFQCTQTQGVVPPMSFLRIPITYTPQAVGTTSIDYFSVISIGDISRSIVKCIGTSIGPKVELSTYTVNFMEVDQGCSGTRTLEIINNSGMEAVYEFEIDCEESVFKLPATSGVLKPNSSQTLVLKFYPQQPINYYRRITCLVHNQSPLYLDLLGTCHSETVKPAVLTSEHISRYLTHVERGISVIAPEQLNELLKAGRMDVDKNGCLEANNEEDKAALIPNPPPREVPAIDEYFNDGYHSDIVNIVPHVSLDINVIDFGNCHQLNMPQEQTVNITNHTRGKVAVQWNGDSSHVFSVSPSTLDIPPLKACSFRVAFKPGAPNKLYGNELECHVSYKSLGDFRLVEDRTQCPPWCLTLKCLGHTFQPGNETFLPRQAVLPQVIVFPAINTGESAYRTMVMGNMGDTPIMYDLTSSLMPLAGLTVCGRSRCGPPDDQAADQKIFAVKPSKGILKSGYQVFTVRMTPKTVNSFSRDLLLRLNDNEKYDQTVHLCGSAESADVFLDGEGTMYFKPTCVGTSSTRTYGFKSVSRIPLRFQWKLQAEDKKFLSVKPDNGVIQPNQSLVQSWTFTPRELQKYVLKPTLIAWGQGLSATSSGGKKRQFSLRIIGEGSMGDMQTDHSYVEFGDVVVGSSASRRVNIYNNGNCNLHYRLIIEGLEDGMDSEHRADGRPGLEFNSMEGELPARSKRSLIATVRPVRRIAYSYAISYQLVTPHCPNPPEAAKEPQHLMHLIALGVYPVMTVTDIRSQGSAVGISKKALWGLFSIDNLNAYLDSDPSSEELMYNIATRHSLRKRPSMHTQAILDFNFSAAPVGSVPCTIHIMFENHGTVATDWAFMSPRDIQMEMGYWAESGDCNTEELHDMKVMDNKLFQISPTKGCLKPFESQTVTFSYHHTMAGTDRLPVLLKIAGGREIMLNFVGVTVEPERPYIHFPSSKHVFSPVPVGEKISPTQVYDLYNGGAIPVYYECDLTPLDIIRQENFDQPIFECLNPKGEIPPGRSVSIEWRFFPLEAKTYMVDIPIKVHNGDTAIVTFSGIGYDKRIMGDTMPFSDQLEVTGVPAVQAAEIPGQLGYLSIERISFGNMPLFCQSRRMVFVTNKSKDRSIFFEWHVTSQTDTQYLNIYPVRGEIGPNQDKMCRVTFVASGMPSFYDLDLVCEISDLHEYKNYKRQLGAWQKERERQLNEFTITEHDLDADKRIPQLVEIQDGRPTSRLSKLEALAEGRPVSADGELTKYKTLPPIRQLTEDEKRELDRKRKKKLAQLWQKPEPQKPFLLHLGVTARTHDTKEFQTNFPEEYYHFYIDRTFSEKNTGERVQAQHFVPPTHLHCSLAESNIVASVLGNCLRGLLDDTYFIQAVKKVVQEPIPYFKQFSDRTNSHGARNSPPLSSTPRVPTDLPQHNVESKVSQEQGENQLSRPVTATDIDYDLEGDDSMIQPKAGAVSETISLPETPHSDIGDRMPYMEEERARLMEEATQLKEKQTIKKLPEFGNTVEQVLENTILNLMYEALSSEYSVVSKPRFIAMPRKHPSMSSGLNA